MRACSVLSSSVIVSFSLVLLVGCDDTVTVAPPNAQPVVSAIAGQSADEGAAFSVDLTTYVTDDRDAVADLLFVVVAGGGSFTGATYSNTFAAAGDATVVFLVRDTEGGAAMSSFEVTVAAMANAAPDVGTVAGQTATTNYTFALDVATAAGVTDDNDATAALTFTVTTGDGAFTGAMYTHTFTAPGTYPIDFSVTDTDAASTPGTFTVVVSDPPPANLAPAVTTVPVQSATEATPFSLDLAPYVSDDHDADGDLAFQVTGGGGSFAGTLYSGTFPDDGTVVVQFIVTDTGSMSTLDAFTIVVAPLPVNAAPEIATIPYQWAANGETFKLDLAPYVRDDQDDDADLTFTVTTTEGSFTGSVFSVIFASVGPAIVFFDVTDTEGETSSAYFKVLHVGVTWYVDDELGDDTTHGGTSWADAYKTIQKGLNAASAGDMVVVADGKYAGTGNIDLDFAGKGIYLASAWGASDCFIDCQEAGRAFHFHTGETNDAVVRGFTIRNGKITDGVGGGILCEMSSAPTISKCTIERCQTTGAQPNGRGGGIYCDSSDVVLEGCTIVDNWAGVSTGHYGGGIYCVSSSPQISECTIMLNHAGQGAGVALYDYAHATIERSTISSNTAAQGGGGLLIDHHSNPTLSDCVVSNNDAGTDGEAKGGGIRCEYWGSPTIARCAITGNAAVSGGGLSAYIADPSIDDSTVSNNSALEGPGGGLHFDDANPTLTRCKIGGNVAKHGGAAYMQNLSSPVMDSCQIVNNRGTTLLAGGDVYGGALYIFNNSAAALRNCTIANNEVVAMDIAAGGAILVAGQGSLPMTPTFTNCVIVNNTVSSAGGGTARGGGIYCEDDEFGVCDIRLNNTIVWSNTAGEAGNQIYVGQTAVAVATISVDYSVYADGSGDIDGFGSIVDTDVTSTPVDPATFPDYPQFVDPGTPGYGGVGDYHLQPTSPLIDAGLNTHVLGVDHDLDGDERVRDGNGAYETVNSANASVDLGPYEYQP